MRCFALPTPVPRLTQARPPRARQAARALTLWAGLLTGLLGSGAALASTSTTTLFDPNAGLPASQGWSSFVPPGASQSVSAAGLTFNTSANKLLQAGFGRTDQVLEAGANTTLSFSLQVLAESHNRPERAGFSVIVLNAQHQGVELAFWTDEVWAYSSSFAHGSGASLDTTTLTHYSLNLANGSFVLLADGQSVLSGALVDYSAVGAPYTQANLIFWGDDTTSASAQVLMGSMQLSAVPEPGSAALLGAGTWLVWRRRKPSVALAGQLA